MAARVPAEHHRRIGSQWAVPKQEEMQMYTTTIRRMTATALVVLAAGAPAASARIPDQVMPPEGWPDMHASTATALAQGREKPATDLRSPDARDAAEGRGTFSAPEVTVVKVPQTSPPASSSIDLSDAVIGAGGALAVILLASAGAFAVAHRRRATSVVRTA
jgi:hypothetical protein